jgi:fatty-acyl-CoA synthase
MREYWRYPEETAAAFAEGRWFRTGDVGHQDAEGYFYIDERKRDVIISGGENVYPAEVESVLMEHGGIADAAVVARPHPRWGEAPVAFVVRKPGAALDAAAVLALFGGRLARFKHPHDVIFVDELPRNVMGKVLRFKLRAMAGSSPPTM